MTEFTPLSAMIGGGLIGLSASALLLLNGRIAGISGIVGAALAPGAGDRAGDRAWRLAFLLGLPLGAAVVRAVQGGLPSHAVATSGQLVLAGLLVGVGTQLGSGCTSGHGVCGISRGSKRSIVATCTFMLSGVVTVFVVRHWIGVGS
jgi:uncharacterized membrane protein YedE/YeeE